MPSPNEGCKLLILTILLPSVWVVDRVAATRELLCHRLRVQLIPRHSLVVQPLLDGYGQTGECFEEGP